MANLNVFYLGHEPLIDQVPTQHILTRVLGTHTENEVLLGDEIDAVVDLVVLDDLPAAGRATAEWANGPRFQLATTPQVHIEVDGSSWTMWTDTGRLHNHGASLTGQHGLKWHSPDDGGVHRPSRPHRCG